MFTYNTREDKPYDTLSARHLIEKHIQSHYRIFCFKEHTHNHVKPLRRKPVSREGSSSAGNLRIMVINVVEFQWALLEDRGVHSVTFRVSCGVCGGLRPCLTSGSPQSQVYQEIRVGTGCWPSSIIKSGALGSRKLLTGSSPALRMVTIDTMHHTIRWVSSNGDAEHRCFV